MAQNSLFFIALLMGFGIVALAARQIGDLFARGKLPLITGFLFTGILAGPYVLNIIPKEAIGKLRFLDELSLAYIAFAAGSELIIRQLRSRFKAIRYNTYGQVVVVFSLGSLAFYYLSDFIPFMNIMSPVQKAAISIMAGAILVARSPSSAIAVVNELRAKGPFTKTALGVTVVMDVVVITLFSISVSIAGTVLVGKAFDMGFLLIVLSELSLSIGMGCVLGKLIALVLVRKIHKNFKTFIILALGIGMFYLSEKVRFLSHINLEIEILFEPMLVCMIAGFTAANFSPYRTELMKVLHDVGPSIYIIFFTLTGASLQLDVIGQCWTVALALFIVRAVGIFGGAFSGGLLAGESMKHNRISWMAYITQAGVSLGLAKQVTVEFAQWGEIFTTLMIAVIVLNQIIGPPLFKWALFLAKEAHPRTEGHVFDGIRDAVIFGLDGESLALARLLQSNQWEVKIATTQVKYAKQAAAVADIEIHSMADINLMTLNKLNVAHADSIVAMLSDEENFRICDLILENYGTRNLIVRLNNQTHFKRFHELGALVVEPSTAIVNLLDQFVRSPSAARLLMGLEQGRSIIEFELRNPDLQGVAIRNLHLPLDLHILSIRRNGQLIVSVGFTLLQMGDWLTVVGSPPSLEQMMLQFSDDREHALVHMVGRVTSKALGPQVQEKEVAEIIHQTDDARKIRFDQLIAQSPVMEIDQSMHYDQFFENVAQLLSQSMQFSKETLYQLLMQREAELSTALRPDLAIPHIIIEGRESFHILLARSKVGIYFSELAPKVRAVFVLVGTRDQRNYHLYALSTIAQIVQQPHFQERWLSAKNETTLRNIARNIARG